MMTHWYVALDGDEDATRAIRRPTLRGVGRGIGKVQTGVTLFVREGIYGERLMFSGKTRVTIRSMPGEPAGIDGATEVLRTNPRICGTG
jgi:hypothetical protein